MSLPYALFFEHTWRSSAAALMPFCDAACTGDALYNMPLLFSVSGIVTDTENLSDGQKGFTFEQYDAFVEDVCNGRDPMGMNKLNFFSTILASMDEEYFDGTSVNYDTEGFRQLSQYTFDNVNDNAGRNSSNAAEYYEWNNIISGIDLKIGETASLVGVPSITGMGPTANCICSAAVYAETAAPDGCWEFIETLLSADIQTDMASDGFPVLVEAFETATNEYINSYRNYYEYLDENGDNNLASRLGLSDIDGSIIPTYEDIIRSADRIYAFDAPVMTVVREEIQAYFAEDKSIEEVIELINNRAQTFYDERD